MTNDQSNHYKLATCPCGKDYNQYHALQDRCEDCKAKVVGFMLPKDLRDKLDGLPKNTKSQFCREALEFKFKNHNL